MNLFNSMDLLFLSRICGKLSKDKNDQLIFTCILCKSNFNCLKDLDHHINIIHLSSEKFDDLPIEVIEQILEHLHPSDLAEMSSTCKIYNDLVYKCFQRRYKSEHLKLQIYSTNTSNYIEPFNRYKIQFRKFIPNVRVTILNQQLISFAFRFVNKNCSNQLRSLHLHCNNLVNIHRNHMKLIGDHIKNLEVLELSNIENIQRIISQCKKLQTLNVRGSIAHLNDDWLIRLKIPKLKTFILTHPNDDIDIDLTKFLQNNPHIESIVCYNFTAIRTILSTISHLRYFGLMLVRNDFIQLWNDLATASNEHKIDWIDISIRRFKSLLEDDLPLLGNSLFIRGLHFVINSECLPNFLRMPIQPNVQRLCIFYIDEYPGAENVSGMDSVVDKIIECYPNLRELHLWFRIYYDSHFFNLKKFVSQLKYIKDIYYMETKFRITRCTERGQITMRDLNDLNLARSQNENASHVNIHLYPQYVSLPQRKNLVLNKKFVSILNDKNYMLCPMCSPYYNGRLCDTFSETFDLLKYLECSS